MKFAAKFVEQMLQASACCAVPLPGDALTFRHRVERWGELGVPWTSGRIQCYFDPLLS